MASQQAPVITFDHVEKRFDGGVAAVKDLHFRIAQGELVAVVGVTGCGKSTAFNLMLGLARPSAGTVRVEGRDPFEEFDWFRRRIAVVFQDARLLPWRTAMQNVCVALRFAGIPKEEREPRARDWLGRLGLAGREHAFPYQLSGGQRQRVAIARAFAVDPDIVLCDESFSALDEVTAANLRAEFVQLVRDNHKTGVFITHSITEALTVGDRVLVLRPPGHVAKEITVDPAMDPAAQESLRTEILTVMAPDAAGAAAPAAATTNGQAPAETAAPAAATARIDGLVPGDADHPALAYTEAGPADGPAVVLLHSLGADRRMWDPQVEALAGWCRVIVPDARGHGASGSATGYGVDEWTDDLDRLLDHTGAGQAALVGLSMGGVQALAYAARRPARVWGLVLADTFAELEPATAQAKLEQLAGQATSQAAMPAFADSYMADTITVAPPPPGAADVRAAIAAMTPENYQAAAQACFGARLGGARGAVKAPALVLWGAADQKTPRSLAENLSTGIARATLVDIPAAGHLANLENPVRFTAEVDGFLRRHQTDRAQQRERR